jgi:hypothetical protein
MVRGQTYRNLEPPIRPRRPTLTSIRLNVFFFLTTGRAGVLSSTADSAKLIGLSTRIVKCELTGTPNCKY